MTENKKALFDYEVIQSWEAGIVLSGAELKSIRGGGANLTGSRVIFREDGVFVVGLTISRYKFDSRQEYDPLRTRKILIHKKEMLEIQAKMKSAGLTLIPLKLYNKGSLVKMQIALVRGKKKFEKREILKKRAVDLGLSRRLKISR